MNSREQLVEQIRHIKDQYEAQVTGKHKQWPRAIKERTVALADSGMKIRMIADQTGISRHTVASWTAQMARGRFRELTVSKKVKALPGRPRITKVTNGTVTKELVAVTKRRNGSVTLKTPGGFLIEGLRVEDIAKLLKRIGTN